MQVLRFSIGKPNAFAKWSAGIVELTQTNNIKQHCGMKPRIWFQKLNFYCSNHESDEIPIPVKFDHLIEAANIGISPRILNPPWQHRRFTWVSWVSADRQRFTTGKYGQIGFVLSISLDGNPCDGLKGPILQITRFRDNTRLKVYTYFLVYTCLPEHRHVWCLELPML